MADERRSDEAALIALLALTTHYFPRTDSAGKTVAAFHEATFFAHRKPRAWSRWAALTHAERGLIRQVMALAPPEWTSEHKIKNAVLELVGSFALDDDPDDQSAGTIVLAGDDPFKADAAYVRAGGDYLGLAHNLTDRFFTWGRRRRAHPFAGPGTWRTRTADLGEKNGVTNRQITFQPTGSFREAPGHEALPTLDTRPYREQIAPAVDELLRIADFLDTRTPDAPYLHSTLRRFFQQLKSTDDSLDEFVLLSGLVNLLNAPTASGKTVLTRVLASWAALHGCRIALIVPDVESTLEMRWTIANDLAWIHQHRDLDWLDQYEHLDVPRTVAALFSPRGMQRRALTRAALNADLQITAWEPRRKSDIGLLAYGCGQRPLMEPHDLYPHGEENCLTLSAAGEGGNALHACPFVPVCGKFAQFYDAQDATVIVTSHANLMAGTTRIGMVLDGQEVRGRPRGTAGLTVMETILRGCDAVVVDEIDAFLSTVIASCVTETTLASRRIDSDLWNISKDFRRLPTFNASQILNSLHHTDHMATSTLLWSISKNGIRLNPGTVDDGSKGASRDNAGWRMAKSRDRDIIALLFPGQGAKGSPLAPGPLAFLNTLMPDRWQQDIFTGEPEAPDGATDWAGVRETLKAIVAPRGDTYFAEAKTSLHDLLAKTLPEGQQRAALINLLICRAVLLDLELALGELRYQAQSARHLDLASVRKILDAVESSAVAGLYPTAMLGAPINGFQLKGMDRAETNAELLTRFIGGDPHTFVSELGGLTALLSAGVERPVLGLSATSYFPQAVSEHIHAPVRWWIPDVRPRSVTVLADPVHRDGRDGREAIRVGGIYAERKPAVLRELGQALYQQKIQRRLQKLHKTKPQQARALLVPNSYEQAAHLASGVAMAEGLSHRVCVLVKSHDQPQDWEKNIPAHVTRLTREELHRFPDLGEVLVAPLPLIYRGLNIVVGVRSAIHDVYLCTRPYLSIEATDWLHASVNAAGMNALPPGGSDNPVAALRAAQEAAWARLMMILRSPANFSNITTDLQEELVATMIVQLIQLAGRGRRGETDMRLFIVDESMNDASFSAGMAAIIRRIEQSWNPEQRTVMQELYGEALKAFLAYADMNK
ncbi:hypothetical protein OG689_41320 [Kitasatospora sp. NBC_00240]|uniref:hypothetical protein n=1 Tax=Kitasatospora sp. NBC_00240 TaxID=2903567 RepID=UPI0022559061|nr:hypothetical protein [Kitasatospora sp. NBC_00240]MCX5215597.1 hypothetical protein [Kitasatospora sp. NBC_00240]